MSPVSVLIIGAGGELGRPLVQEFIQQKASFKRIAILAANEEKAAQFADAREHGIEVVVGSFLEPTSYTGFTHVLCTVGNALIPSQPAMIDAAIAAGVTHFYPSEWNSDISQPEIADMRYFRDKQLVRAHLAARAKDLPPEFGFGYTLFITGIFTEWAASTFYGFDHDAVTATVYGKPDARVGVTSIPDVARYTVESLLIPFDELHSTPTSPTNPNPYPNRSSARTIRVQGSTQPFSSLIAALSRARGREYSVTYLDPALAAQKQEQARLVGDEWGEMMWSIKPLVASGYGVADGGGGGGGGGEGGLDNGRFGFRPEGAEETFRRVYGGADATGA